MIIKEYEIRASGQVTFFSIPNIWSGVLHLQEHGITCNFFTWFSDHSLSGSDKIVLIKGKMWPNSYNTTCYVKGNQITFRGQPRDTLKAIWVLVWLTPTSGNYPCSRVFLLPSTYCYTCAWPTVMFTCWRFCTLAPLDCQCSQLQ